MDKQQFGTFVAQLRKEQGMTQQALAERLLISNKAVSKWETGVSIPDVELLLPLADVLGVTVAELLQGQRLAESVEKAQVEDIVQQAIELGGPTPRQRTRHLAVYLLCMTVAAVELVLMWSQGILHQIDPDCLPLAVVFGALFGAWFLFLARERLPGFYDENKLNGMIDGIFRMNIPGIRFHNCNWPHILRVGRIWSMTTLAGYPALTWAMAVLAPEFWQVAEKPVFLTALLGGLFVPMIYVGKKYE